MIFSLIFRVHVVGLLHIPRILSFLTALCTFTCTIFTFLVFFFKGRRFKQLFSSRDVNNNTKYKRCSYCRSKHVVIQKKRCDMNSYSKSNTQIYEQLSFIVYISFQYMLITHSILQGISNRKLNNQAKSQYFVTNEKKQKNCMVISYLTSKEKKTTYEQ